MRRQVPEIRNGENLQAPEIQNTESPHVSYRTDGGLIAVAFSRPGLGVVWADGSMMYVRKALESCPARILPRCAQRVEGTIRV